MIALGAHDQLERERVSYLHCRQIDTGLIQALASQKNIAKNAVDGAEPHIVANRLERADGTFTRQTGLIGEDIGRMVALGACGHLERQGISNLQSRQIDT